MQALFSLGKLVQLDFERCPRIHGGFVHLQGLSKLESLSIRCCQCIMDSDMEPLPGIASLKELQVVCVYITDYGVSYLGGLNKLVVLNMEGSHVTTSCLDTISGLTKLEGLNFDSCKIMDDGFAHLSANCCG
ncbi:F-box protein isoform X4 [Capsicum galapagoense]